MVSNEIPWAAGLFEGEGNFNSYDYKKRGYRRYQASVAMKSYDRDVLERLQKATGLGRIYGPYGKAEMLHWRVTNFGNVQALAAMFWKELGQRRREQIKKCLAA